MKRRRSAMIAALAALSVACGSHRPPPTVTVQELDQVHRPSWLQGISADFPAIRDCVQARDESAYAVYVYRLSDRTIGVTTVSPQGVAVQCAWDTAAEVVVDQQASDIDGGDLSKQPMLALGKEPPQVPVGSHLEPVRDADQTVAWLFWLPL